MPTTYQQIDAENNKLRQQLAAAKAEIAELKREHWRREGEDHKHPCDYGALCPWCEIETLTAKLADAEHLHNKTLNAYDAVVKERAALKAKLADAQAENAELKASIQQAIGMLSKHLDEYHDHDIPENTEGPRERKSLENIEYHLMGSIPQEPTALGAECNNCSALRQVEYEHSVTEQSLKEAKAKLEACERHNTILIDSRNADLAEIERLKAKLADAETASKVHDAVEIAAHLSKDIAENESLVAWVKRIIKEREDLKAKLAESEKPPMGHRCDHCGKHTNNKAEGTFILCDACNGNVFKKLENATMPELRAWVSGMEKKLAESEAGKAVCKVCGGGPGNDGVCLCGLHDYAEAGKVNLEKLAVALESMLRFQMDMGELSTEKIVGFIRNWKETK